MGDRKFFHRFLKKLGGFFDFSWISLIFFTTSKNRLRQKIDYGNLKAGKKIFFFFEFFSVQTKFSTFKEASWCILGHFYFFRQKKWISSIYTNMNGLKVPMFPRNLGKKIKLPQNPPNSSFKRGEFGLHTEKSQKQNIFFPRP